MIKDHPTHLILDSSKLDIYLDCPRKFFYEYILGWRRDIPAHDLHFGTAWHEAREHQLLHGYEDVEGAYAKFINCYREVFPQETDAIYTPKDPTAVAMALLKFAQERKSDLRNNKVLYTEISGTVPISEDGKVLHYRMDSVIERKEDGMIFSWDHKSGSEKSINFRGWDDKFQLGIQAGTYTHCLYCLYPIKQVLGIEFCGTGFGYLKRTKEYRITLKRVPVWKTPDQMNNWLWTVNELYDNIMRDMDRLNDCSENDSILMTFHMNPGACTKYWGCPYHDFCLTWNNPLRNCYEPPLGFKEEFWDPSAMETTNKMNLEFKG